MTTENNARHFRRPFGTIARHVTRDEARALVKAHREALAPGTSLRFRMRPIGKGKGYRVVVMERAA